METTILAEKVAEVLGDVMQGFHIHATRAPKWEWPEDSTAIVCVANNDVKRDPSTGLVSGSVTVYFRRPGLYKAIPVAALEDAATAYRFGLEVRSHEIGDDKHRGVWVKKQAYGGAEVNAYKDPHAHVVDVMKVDVRNVIDGYPVIKRVDLSHLGTAMRGITVEVYRAGNESSAVQHAPAPENSPSTWQVIEGRNILALGGHKVAVVSEEVNDQGVRTLAVQYGVGTFNTHPGDFTEGLEAVLEDRQGLTFPGCGLLVGSKVERTSDNYEQRVHNYVTTLTFESKTA